MSKKIAFITGANRGIGFEVAKQLGALGFHVVLGIRDTKKLESTVKALASQNIVCEALHFDAKDPATHKEVAIVLSKKFGLLDVLINNAAVNHEGDGGEGAKHTSETSIEWMRDTFETNVIGVHSLTQALMPLLKKSQAARIVNVSSILGSLTLQSDPNSGIYETKLPAYDISKTALNAYTVHLAYELRDTQHKVNAAHPGWVKTDMGGPDAPLEIQDGAKTLVQLATLPANGPTGALIHMGETIPW